MTKDVYVQKRQKHMAQLRRMFDEQTLVGLLDDLVDICQAKTVHIAEKDKRLVREWDRATRIVAQAAEEIRENQPRERIP